MITHRGGWGLTRVRRGLLVSVWVCPFLLYHVRIRPATVFLLLTELDRRRYWVAHKLREQDGLREFDLFTFY